MSEEPSRDASAKRERHLAKNFRWQAFFQRSAEPVFVLDRRRRLLFVNRAWEALTGIAKEQAHLLVCRKPQPVSAKAPAEEILAHALTPPREVMRGQTGWIRRRLPGKNARDRWWEIEFFPLLQIEPQGGYLIVGRIHPVPPVELQGESRPFENLVPLRQRRLQRFSLDAWSSSLPAMHRLREQIRLASQVTTPVLLVGEAGSGKQTLARTIHYLSPRRDGACAVIDCQHLPPTAIANLLFGPERFAAVYLREPAFLPRDLQLLLCERFLRPLSDSSGADSALRPRIFAGCAMPPTQAVDSGRMLDELAYGLSALMLEVPPLRERRTDLPALVERLLPRACAGRDVAVTSLSADAWAVMREYSWPGNFRELYHVLRTACAHASGEQLRAADFPAELCRAVQREQLPPRPVDKSLPLEQLLEEAERRLIHLALQRAQGHKARAARLLGIPRPRLWRRMLKLGIIDTEDEPQDEAPVPPEEE